MTFVGNSQWGRVALCWEISLLEVCIVLNAKHDTTPTSTDFGNLALAAEDWVINDLLPNQSSGIRFDQTTVYDMSSESAPVYTRIAPAAQVGGQGAPVAPLTAAAVVTHRTAGRGRSFRGRTYVPGLVELDMSDVLVSTARQTALAAAFVALAVRLLNNNWTHVVASTIENGLPRSSALLTPVIGYDVQPYIGTQRRRGVADT